MSGPLFGLDHVPSSRLAGIDVRTLKPLTGAEWRELWERGQRERLERPADPLILVSPGELAEFKRLGWVK